MAHMLILIRGIQNPEKASRHPQHGGRGVTIRANERRIAPVENYGQRADAAKPSARDQHLKLVAFRPVHKHVTHFAPTRAM
jgi:hypothetical protein